jgi:protein-tyrosine phosphatase
MPDDIPVEKSRDLHDALLLLGNGKVGLARCPGVMGYDLQQEIREIKDSGASLLVSLLPDDDYYHACRPDEFIRALEEAGLEQLSHPIIDLGVPEDLDAYVKDVVSIAERVKKGEKIVIHCLAGIGRTGMTAACVLVALGCGPARARELVRSIPSDMRRIQGVDQERLVDRFADVLSAAG